MNLWFRKDLGNGMKAYDQLSAMQKAFTEVFLLAPAGSGLAMFSRYDLASDNVEIYLTPESGDMALIFEAIPCAKPEPNEFRFSLLCGDGRDLEIHFPLQGRD